MNESLFFYLAAVPVLGVLAQMLSHWLRLPSILLLLTFGVLLGLFANPDQLLEEISESPATGPAILFPIVSLAVAIILFEGGLTLKIEELRHSGSAVIRMVTLGAAISLVLTTLAAQWCLGMEIRVALLLGAVLVVTGPTVIKPLIRHIRPTKKIGSILRWEGIVIDPIGAILAVLVFEQLIQNHSDQPFVGALLLLGKTVLLGTGLAWFLSRLLSLMVNRFLIPDFLHGAVFLATTLGSFAFSEWLAPESGLVTVTALGIFLANTKSISIGHIVEFNDNLGILLISCLFIVLGSRLDLGQLASAGPGAILFVVLLIAVIRPASVVLSLMGTDLSWREQLFLALVAPRGIVAAAVASVFALKVMSLAVHDPQLESLVSSTRQLAPIVFLVIICTVTFYGLLAAPLARWLGLSNADPQGILFASASEWVRDLALIVQKSGFPVMLVDTHYSLISKARVEGLNAHCASVLSEKVEDYLEFSGIGRLLAVTSNDEVNELATITWAQLFGRQNVYRLAPIDSGKGARSSLGSRVGGRIWIGSGVGLQAIEKNYHDGWRFKATKLTTEFSMEEFHWKYGKDVIVVMYMNSGKLAIVDDETQNNFGADQTLIALVPPQPTSEDVVSV